ncbi:hypothetical protein TDB9533_04209 [Thalassocella blandensis]|nr:hypothetical protein TDB9533_04209 [Thalassocella blandensis]
MSSSSTTRYIALDALRGLTIALMILVNTPGSWSYIYAPFQHADWHGCTPTDLVFPFFMCIVGAAMYFSFAKDAFQWSSEKGLKIAKRTCIIFLIGLFLNAYPFHQGLDDLRILGVLQRIALSYAIAAIIVLSFSRNVVLLICGLILLGYWVVMVGFGSAVPFSLEGNAVLKLDKIILGDSHLWQGKGVPFDPEGILSTLPSVVNVLFGFLVAGWLSSQMDKLRAVKGLIAAGAVLLVTGLLWGLVFPINKSLWTSTFVVYTCGYFSIALAFFIWLVDIKQCKSTVHPLIVYGSNPLFIYALSGLWVMSYSLISFAPPANDLYGAMYLFLEGFLAPKVASLVFALLHVIFFWCISLILYKKKIFIKV